MIDEERVYLASGFSHTCLLECGLSNIPSTSWGSRAGLTSRACLVICLSSVQVLGGIGVTGAHSTNLTAYNGVAAFVAQLRIRAWPKELTGSNWSLSIAAAGRRSATFAGLAWIRIPVTWTKGFRKIGRRFHLEIWLNNPEELAKHTASKDPFVVALAVARNYTNFPHSFKEFHGVLKLSQPEISYLTAASTHM